MVMELLVTFPQKGEHEEQWWQQNLHSVKLMNHQISVFVVFILFYFLRNIIRVKREIGAEGKISILLQKNRPKREDDNC